MILDRSSRAVLSSTAPARRRWFVTLSLIAALGMIAVGAILWQTVGLTSLSKVAEQITTAKPFATALRFTLIGLVAIAWPRLRRRQPKANRQDDLADRSWMALRWRVIGWLLIIELVLGQNLIGHF
ncbi:MAG: hypothetical protein AAF317_08715, partial [Pseudomonadota bacterium]